MKTSLCDAGVEIKKDVSLDLYSVVIEVTIFDMISIIKIARKPREIILLIENSVEEKEAASEKAGYYKKAHDDFHHPFAVDILKKRSGGYGFVSQHKTDITQF